MERRKLHHAEVVIEAGGAVLEGTLTLPEKSNGIIVFAHGSGSSRFSSRNRFVAGYLNRGGLATLLFDLLTAEEHRIDEWTRELRFDIDLLSRRLVGTVDWLQSRDEVAELATGLFGASTGAAAALRAAAERPERIAAVVSRGGRPDLTGNDALARVKAPTLLIVGGEDEVVIGMNRAAAAHLRCEHSLEIVPGATHLFEEPGALEQVARLARQWFLKHLGPR
ncbi:MAG: dienelactone hydrolase family protein [Burkholderiales bacterium]